MGRSRGGMQGESTYSFHFPFPAFLSEEIEDSKETLLINYGQEVTLQNVTVILSNKYKVKIPYTLSFFSHIPQVSQLHVTC